MFMTEGTTSKTSVKNDHNKVSKKICMFMTEGTTNTALSEFFEIKDYL